MPSKIHFFLLYAFSFLKDFSLIGGIFSILYLAHSLSEAEIFLLLGMYQGSILLAEIPTGYIASRFGDRKAVISGMVFHVLAVSLLLFATNFVLFACVQMLFAISVAFLSGSFSSFLNGFSLHFWKNFVDIRSRTRSLGLIAGLLSVSIGTAMLPLWFENIFLIQIFTTLVALILFVFLPTFIEDNTKISKSFCTMWQETKKVFAYKKIFYSAFFVFSFLAIEAVTFSLFQIDYVTLWFAKELLGIFLTLFTVSSLVFLYLFKQFPKVFSIALFPSIAIVFVISASLYKMFHIPVLIFLLLLTQIIRPMDILVENMIFQKVSDNSASFILSFLSFFERIFFVCFSFVIGIIHISPNILIVITSFALLILAIWLQKQMDEW